MQANVNDFQVIPTIQVLLTNLLDILYSQRRFQRGSVYVQRQEVLCLERMGARLSHFRGRSALPLSRRAGLFRGLFHVDLSELGQTPGCRAKPINVRSVLERSPMIFRTGPGRSLTKVGTATIWSPRAICGFFKRSITSIR